MPATAVVVEQSRYVDSVELLAVTRAMLESDGVEFATAVMGTPANVAALQDQGFSESAVASAMPNDLVLAVRAENEGRATDAVGRGEHALSASRQVETARPPTKVRSIDTVADANVAIVSVPGAYAALEAHKALTAGLHVLLFSDNVSVDDEVALKDHAAAVGRLLMGPGAGTASLGGCGLGFANVVAAGRVGVVAAAGTGAQEVMVLLDRWGEGVSHVIGVGGRDLSAAVAGASARRAIRALEADPATDVVLLVSKPPAPDVASAVVTSAHAKPLVATLVGLDATMPVHETASVSATLEGGVRRVIELLGGTAPSDWSGWRDEVERSLDGLDPDRRTVRGLYSGGTLCYETLTLLQPLLGAVWSNTLLDDCYRMPAPGGTHVCLDLGEEEYTKGRPHPMIDAEARIEQLTEIGNHDDVAVVLLDVVLGYGAHPDPASVLAPVCAALAKPGGPRVVVYVLGTDRDPQGLVGQRSAFRQAGCILAPTAARAALAAAAIALRRPDLAATELR